MVFGEHGVLDAMQDGKAFVDMTTVDIATVTGVSEVSYNRKAEMLYFLGWIRKFIRNTYGNIYNRSRSLFASALGS